MTLLEITLTNCICESPKCRLSLKLIHCSSHEKNNEIKGERSICLSICEDFIKIFGTRNDFVAPVVTLVAD